MNQEFKGWKAVAARLNTCAGDPFHKRETRGYRLNPGQHASLRAIADRIPQNGVVIADEVGMGKTCIAVELASSVIASGGRVAILIPPGLGYQWQDELRKGDVEAPLVLRSLRQYLSVWEPEDEDMQEPWFEKQVVVISHLFTNWRLHDTSHPQRWALLPELYALWRKRTLNRLPRGYNGNEKLADSWVSHAAKSICNGIPDDEHHPAWRLMNRLSEETPWPGALQGSEYGRNQNLRPWLERAIGLGLGVFDLIIIDEAHKSRGSESGLSRLVENVVLSSGSARRFALTATPVELDVSQWQQIFSRIGLDDALVPIQQAIDGYAGAVKRVRQCPHNQAARDAYRQAATTFQETLSPYLLRRDKREDPAVQLFAKHSSLPVHAYRHETEIAVETESLSTSWKQAVCAAEALSVVPSQAEDSMAKRLRLTIGNGHGISALIDQTQRDEALDKKQAEYDATQSYNGSGEKVDSDSDLKRHARARWWLDVVAQAFSNGEDALFDHPAILAAVKAIETVAARGEKVLVFGRFTRPLRALVDLLNAREMLRCLQSDRLWSQGKIHGHPDDGMDHSEWPAVRAAHRQLQCPIPLAQMDQKLKVQYERLENQRKKLRRSLISNIEEGLRIQGTDHRMKTLFAAFRESVDREAAEGSERHSLVLVGNALHELMGNGGDPLVPAHFSQAFMDLMDALSDRDKADSNGDGNLDEYEAKTLWSDLKAHLNEEFSRTQGGFARLMFGGTRQDTRRLIQLAFNRLNSFPRVLVAQSMVGREGLNLHKACRVVVLLHPEWNPGVVEQQIGRVDRVGSYWSRELEKAVASPQECGEFPRIEVCPVIFKGTYDEHNWKVLNERWEELRAQLHGIVVPEHFSNNEKAGRNLADEINMAAPSFSPS